MLAKKLRISIACCTYNGSEYVLEQLASFAKQTRLPDELIICDDNSSDNTLEILEAFAKTAPFQVSIYTNKENSLGSTKNFEKAIGLCKGEVIALADQDDIWFPTKLERFEQEFQQGAELIFSNGDIVDNQLHSKGYTLFESLNITPTEMKLIQQEKLKEVLIRRNLVTGAACAFKSKHNSLILPISENWIHDGWIAILISTIGKCVMVNESLFQYRQHDKNQIGAGKLNISEKIKKARLLGSKHYNKQYQAFIDLKVRLKLAGLKGINNETFLKELEGKIRHLNRKCCIPNGSFSTFYPLILMLIRFEYHRYSRGWISFSRDIIMTWIFLLEKYTR